MTEYTKISEFDHVEAFCIMKYKCINCGHIELIWNSRDGVTPFTIWCVKCGFGAEHIDWLSDTRDKDYIPPVGSRVFIDFPESLKRTFALKTLKDRNQYITEEKIQSMMQDFNKGLPYLITL